MPNGNLMHGIEQFSKSYKYIANFVDANQDSTSGEFISAISADTTREEMQFQKKVNELEKRIQELETFLFVQPPSYMLNAIKGMLKPKGDPFDPSQYSYKLTSDELDELEKILEDS
ncbi:MAG: hypothetical protein M1135_02360 [Candidatus Omnitrophica bacterium]|nr:hypothetical protein [Candidatus Omnitrophota bacterium]